MAQNVSIPIGFEWRPRPASWKVVTAKVTGWALESARGEPHFLAHVAERGAHYRLEVPWWAFSEQTLRLLQLEKGREFRRGYPLELLVCSAETQRGIQREGDAWLMREEFLRLQPDTKALLAFLNRWGVWGPTRTGVYAPPEPGIPNPTRRGWGPLPGDRDPKRLPADIRAAVWGQAFAESTVLDRQALNYLFSFDVWHFQKQCREALMKPAGKWLPTQKVFDLVPRPQYPHYVRQAVTCQRAIVDTIIIDLLTKAKFRLCSRPDCRAPFRIESQHKRVYCSQSCGHLESIRRIRRRTKQARKQEKSNDER